MTDQELSFDESHAQRGPVTCSRCTTPLTEYWTVDGQVMCEPCMDEVHAERSSPDGRGGRVAKAIGLGVLAMLVGAGIWAFVAFQWRIEHAIVAVVLGFLVGKAVQWGSEKRGGPGYQFLAIALTYFGIGAGMAPYQAAAFLNDPAVIDSLKLGFDSTESGLGPPPDSGLATIEATSDSLPVSTGKEGKTGEVSDSALDAELAALDSVIAAGGKAETEDPLGTLPAPLLIAIGLVGVFIGILALPILSILEGNAIISILIYGFAFYEAWKLNRRIEPVVSGPHQVGAATA